MMNLEKRQRKAESLEDWRNSLELIKGITIDGRSLGIDTQTVYPPKQQHPQLPPQKQHEGFIVRFLDTCESAELGIFESRAAARAEAARVSSLQDELAQ